VRSRLVSDLRTSRQCGAAWRHQGGIWFNQRLIDELGELDRHIVAERIATIANQQKAGHSFVDLTSGLNLLYYKALNPETKLSPTYHVCLYR
jgi:hypothetical protein